MEDHFKTATQLMAEQQGKCAASVSLPPATIALGRQSLRGNWMRNLAGEGHAPQSRALATAASGAAASLRNRRRRRCCCCCGGCAGGQLAC